MQKKPAGALRIATWNVNSVRARLPLIRKFVHMAEPDILCLQETKVSDSQFPLGWFEKEGYTHRALKGQGGYHGVATFSRVPLADVRSRDWCGRGDPRHVQATIAGGVDLHNFYVPAGGDIPDPQDNPRFAHKLDFLDEMIDWSERLDEPAILLGDLNVAPLETDVWSHRQLLKVVSHTPPETERMFRLLETHGWIDVMREFVDPSEPLFSWWSYRARDWRKSNRGRRLDHIWASPGLGDRLRWMHVLDEARDWTRPSDHVPVIADLALE